VEPAFIARFHTPLLRWIGNLETSRFQTLSEGKTAQSVPGTGARCVVVPAPDGSGVRAEPGAVVVAATSIPSAADTARIARNLMPTIIGSSRAPG
jgi:hypothetical protein